MKYAMFTIHIYVYYSKYFVNNDSYSILFHCHFTYNLLYITYLPPYPVDITKRVIFFSPRFGDRNHIQPQTMGDPIFTT